MSADPNKKSGRSFQCRDVLWETFEQMARELECSVDYLINEAMKQYARQRSYGPRTGGYPGGAAQREEPPPRPSGRGGGGAGAERDRDYQSAPPPPMPPPQSMRNTGAMPPPRGG